MIKLNYRFSRTARLGFIAVALLLVANLYTTFLTNFFLTDVIAGYAAQNRALKQQLWRLNKECYGDEGYDGQSSWDRYGDKYAGPGLGLMPYMEEQLTGTPRTYNM